MRVMMKDEDENENEDENEGLLTVKGLAFGFGCARGKSSSNRTKETMSRTEQKTTTLFGVVVMKTVPHTRW